jgi:hypothetical protein
VQGAGAYSVYHLVYHLIAPMAGNHDNGNERAPKPIGFNFHKKSTELPFITISAHKPKGSYM